eukprot:13601020-Heterocapsa_arctica.AAC.1
MRRGDPGSWRTRTPPRCGRRQPWLRSAAGPACTRWSRTIANGANHGASGRAFWWATSQRTISPSSGASAAAAASVR